jgi:hypothetical protein
VLGGAIRGCCALAAAAGRQGPGLAGRRGRPCRAGQAGLRLAGPQARRRWSLTPTGPLRPARLDARVAEAAALLATVTGQDIEETCDGRLRISKGAAPDRVLSTVDPRSTTATRPPPAALTATGKQGVGSVLVRRRLR